MGKAGEIADRRGRVPGAVTEEGPNLVVGVMLPGQVGKGP